PPYASTGAPLGVALRAVVVRRCGHQLAARRAAAGDTIHAIALSHNILAGFHAGPCPEEPAGVRIEQPCTVLPSIREPSPRFEASPPCATAASSSPCSP